MSKLEEFAFWFSGYLESEPTQLNKQQIELIRNKLKAAMRREVIYSPNQFGQEELNR